MALCQNARVVNQDVSVRKSNALRCLRAHWSHFVGSKKPARTAPTAEPALGPKPSLLFVPGCFDGAVYRGLTVSQDLVDRHLAG